ncbi:hypothetical protein [Actinophytocola sp.]|uniref:hypothetical protein n=1 Tax=Actinophytocola sp. TaxID=1872138 RepID=UPI002DB8B037|nr:hypothetical protein [Actinophytocola sp.]
MAAIAPDESGWADDIEQRLINAVERGEVLDLVGDGAVDEAVMRSWGTTRTVPARLIRNVLRGRLVSDPDPHGLRLRGARIAGRLDLENLTSVISLELTNCVLDEGINARDATLHRLVLTECLLEHPSAAALDATRLTATVLGFAHTTARAHTALGAVRLLGAHLGSLDGSGASLRNDTGPALHADHLEVDQNMFLRGGFTAVGAGEPGAVRLFGAHIRRLECDGANLRNDTGPALNADGLRVDRRVFLRDGFTAVGAGRLGAVRLHGAHLGILECVGASLRNDTGPALRAGNLKVDRNVLLCAGFEVVGGGDDVAVDLTGVRVGGVLVFDPRRLEHRVTTRRRLRVDGLVYPGLPRGISGRAWLELLREGTPEYAAQPYQHLAAVHRAAGHDREARQILMAQRRDQIDRRALTGGAERTWARFTGLVLGYGYQPWRALLGLALVTTTAVTLAVILGGHGGLTQVRTSSTECTWTERVGVGIDLGAPLITTGTQTRCQTTNTTTGQTLAAAGWILRLLAWAFATLFVAGFTTAVRKT